MIQSLLTTENRFNSSEDLLGWIQERNRQVGVSVEPIPFRDMEGWRLDEDGNLRHVSGRFFSVQGIHVETDYGLVHTWDQPIIVQPEIGYLGILAKEFNGVLHFLMQAKIEPGNVNCVQISPTIQATKSNFTRAHGGKLPTYFELFEHSEKYEIIYDQIQSEQATRFYKKRNRNIIMIVDEDFEVYSNFRWMTLGQIKKLMEVDNLVNMDTRTVLSGIPVATQQLSDEEKNELATYFSDDSLFRSMFYPNPQETIPQIFHKINNYKMFRDIRIATVPLGQLVDWKTNEYGITCKKQADFMVRYYDIEISGREVQHWTQPLFKAIGMATFGLLSRVNHGKREFLVKIKPEIGSFDKVELGPTVQWESSHYLYNDNEIDALFRSKLEKNEGILTKVVLSEEGGRFYHEQNNNVIIEIEAGEFSEIPNDYIWSDYATLNYLVQVNNCLNIQLRNLLSLLKV